MSMESYEKARELIKNAGGGDFEGAKPESLVFKAEAALGVKFPPSYRQFLLEMGCGDFNGVEVFGLINDNFERSTVPNGIWLTLNERESIHLDPSYVIIGDGGDGTYYALDTKKTSATGENPVVRLSINGEQSKQIFESFGSYLLHTIRAVI